MKRLLTLVALLLFPVMGTTAEAATTQPCTNTPTTYNHVIVWMLENHSYDQTRGHMPYLDSIANQCGYFTKERAITHPSLPTHCDHVGGSGHCH
jgi:phospholipase C